MVWIGENSLLSEKGCHQYITVARNDILARGFGVRYPNEVLSKSLPMVPDHFRTRGAGRTMHNKSVTP